MRYVSAFILVLSVVGCGYSIRPPLVLTQVPLPTPTATPTEKPAEPDAPAKGLLSPTSAPHVQSIPQPAASLLAAHPVATQVIASTHTQTQSIIPEKPQYSQTKLVPSEISAFRNVEASATSPGLLTPEREAVDLDAFLHIGTPVRYTSVSSLTDMCLVPEVQEKMRSFDYSNQSSVMGMLKLPWSKYDMFNRYISKLPSGLVARLLVEQSKLLGTLFALEGRATSGNLFPQSGSCNNAEVFSYEAHHKRLSDRLSELPQLMHDKKVEVLSDEVLPEQKGQYILRLKAQLRKNRTKLQEFCSMDSSDLYDTMLEDVGYIDYLFFTYGKTDLDDMATYCRIRNVQSMRMTAKLIGDEVFGLLFSGIACYPGGGTVTSVGLTSLYYGGFWSIRYSNAQRLLEKMNSGEIVDPDEIVKAFNAYHRQALVGALRIAFQTIPGLGLKMTTTKVGKALTGGMIQKVQTKLGPQFLLAAGAVTARAVTITVPRFAVQIFTDLPLAENSNINYDAWIAMRNATGHKEFHGKNEALNRHLSSIINLGGRKFLNEIISAQFKRQPWVAKDCSTFLVTAQKTGHCGAREIVRAIDSHYLK